MKTISSCPADSVQPPTDYGDYYCKPKSERWISAPVLKWTALLNGHPYHPCFSTALLFQLGKMIAARNHTMSDALSVLCSVHCLVIIRLPTKKSNSKKSSSKPQKRFFPYHRAYVHAILKVHILSEERAKRDPTLTKIRKHEIIRNLLFTFKPFSPELLSFSRIFLTEFRAENLAWKIAKNQLDRYLGGSKSTFWTEFALLD